MCLFFLCVLIFLRVCVELLPRARVEEDDAGEAIIDVFGDDFDGNLYIKLQAAIVERWQATAAKQQT